MEEHAHTESEGVALELPETRGRSRLRELFASTEAGDAVEELIAVHGRELELRSEKLMSAVHDLERREERSRELHTRVEQILREGSAELDQRQAELNARAVELERREAALAIDEERVAERSRELGAVELRRAAVERREEALRARALQLERQAAEIASLASRLDAIGTSTVAKQAAPVPPETSHVILTSGDRYRLVERDGPPPVPGDDVELDEGIYRCIRITISPLPADTRRCAVVERAPQPLPG